MSPGGGAHALGRGGRAKAPPNTSSHGARHTRPVRHAFERLRQPRVLLAVVLLGLTGGLILAFLLARGELVGGDARASWGAVRTWLAGGDPYAPVEPYMPYAYAPWTLILFLPWALLPWSVAWFSWQVMNVALFGWSVGWAFRRRPLATALLVAALGIPLAATLDTGNVTIFLVLGIWLTHFSGPRVGGLAWALGAAMKWLPAVLIVFIPARARLWGLAFLGVALVLSLATFPQTLRQLEVVLNFPRPPRVDYLLLAWAAVPWLWQREWSLDRLRVGALHERWRHRPPLAELARGFVGLDGRARAGAER